MSPSAPASGGRTCARSATASCCRPRGCGWPPTSRPPRSCNLLDGADPDRSRDLCVGTVDSWIVWNLTGGAAHVTDVSNAGLTGLLTPDASGWDDEVVLDAPDPAGVAPPPGRLDRRGRPRPRRCPAPRRSAASPATSRPRWSARAACAPARRRSPSAPAACSTSSWVRSGPPFAGRGEAGTFPIVAWRRGDELVWGVEAIMLAAGSNVEWLRDDLGLLSSRRRVPRGRGRRAPTPTAWCSSPRCSVSAPPGGTTAPAAPCSGSPAGTTRAHLVRAVLEGVAHRGADLVEAAEADTGATIPSLRVDGGMSGNPTFVAGPGRRLPSGRWRCPRWSRPRRSGRRSSPGWPPAPGAAGTTWRRPGGRATTVEPGAAPDRERWARAVERAAGWYPELSALDF